MSDLYLDLKRRIPVVTEWTDVGTEEMERAQARTGLSDEKIARMIPISVKTWSRWKKRGQIPTHLLPKVAPILGFELIPIEQTPITVGQPPEPQTNVLVTTDLRESLATIVSLLTEIAELVRLNSEKLERIAPASGQPGAGQREVHPPAAK